MTETLGLMLRVGLSFTFVLGLMWFAARMLRGKMAARGSGVLEVLARQQVGRGASVAVVRVADRALVVGVTEHGISILGEPISDLSLLIDPATQGEPPTIAGQAAAGRVGIGADRSAAAVGSRPTAALPAANADGALRGSVLSPSTWRQALHVLRERTVRR